MQVVITYSKTKTHKIKVKGADGKLTEKEIPNSYTWLVLDNGTKILINAVKKEDKRLLNAVARVER